MPTASYREPTNVFIGKGRGEIINSSRLENYPPENHSSRLIISSTQLFTVSEPSSTRRRRRIIIIPEPGRHLRIETSLRKQTLIKFIINILLHTETRMPLQFGDIPTVLEQERIQGLIAVLGLLSI